MPTLLRGPGSVQSTGHKETYASVVEKMVNRMHQSRPKYGPLTNESAFKTDLLASAMDRIRLYEKDGNTEWLMDAANFLIIEAMYPAHSSAHFRATSSDESPGYRDVSGVVRHGPPSEINN